MANFTAACYDDTGAMTMNETAKLQLMADKASMTSTVATRDATISALQADKAALQADKAALQADKAGLQADKAGLQADKAALQADKANPSINDCPAGCVSVNAGQQRQLLFGSIGAKRCPEGCIPA